MNLRNTSHLLESHNPGIFDKVLETRIPLRNSIFKQIAFLQKLCLEFEHLTLALAIIMAAKFLAIIRQSREAKELLNPLKDPESSLFKNLESFGIWVFKFSLGSRLYCITKFNCLWLSNVSGYKIMAQTISWQKNRFDFLISQFTTVRSNERFHKQATFYNLWKLKNYTQIKRWQKFLFQI